MATTVAIPLTIAITAPPRIRPWRRLRGRPRPYLEDTLPVRLLRFYPLVARVLSGFVHRCKARPACAVHACDPEHFPDRSDCVAATGRQACSILSRRRAGSASAPYASRRTTAGRTAPARDRYAWTPTGRDSRT